MARGCAASDSTNSRLRRIWGRAWSASSQGLCKQATRQTSEIERLCPSSRIMRINSQAPHIAVCASREQALWQYGQNPKWAHPVNWKDELRESQVEEYGTASF